MFTNKIKEATLTNHQQVEKLLVSKMKSMRSKQDYIDLLHIFYGYFGGLEQAIGSYINEANLADYTKRRKSEAIADDLKALGSQTQVMADTDYLPKIINELQAFGALYVMEGSTLGGKIISQMIQKHLNISAGPGLSFFNGYGDETMQMWEAFKLTLNNTAKNEADETAIIAAANDTFSKFKLWIEKPVNAYS
jgi:heme oxygenase